MRQNKIHLLRNSMTGCCGINSIEFDCGGCICQWRSSSCSRNSS